MATYTIKCMPEFDIWLSSIKDGFTRIRLARRIDRLQRGLLGDVAPVGEGVHELREFFGPGWRIYFTQRKGMLIVLLGGGAKSTQKEDIASDMADHLQTEEDVANYLTLVLADNDPAELRHALGTIARAKGMSEVALASGLTREALYKALRRTSQPRFDTITKVCAALGVKLVAVPLQSSTR